MKTETEVYVRDVVPKKEEDSELALVKHPIQRKMEKNHEKR